MSEILNTVWPLSQRMQWHQAHSKKSFHVWNSQLLFHLYKDVLRCNRELRVDALKSIVGELFDNTLCGVVISYVNLMELTSDQDVVWISSKSKWHHCCVACGQDWRSKTGARFPSNLKSQQQPVEIWMKNALQRRLVNFKS